MTNASAREIIESYRAALGKGDFSTARNLMQNSFHRRMVSGQGR
jgi:hypothetical protein